MLMRNTINHNFTIQKKYLRHIYNKRKVVNLTTFKENSLNVHGHIELLYETGSVN